MLTWIRAIPGGASALLLAACASQSPPPGPEPLSEGGTSEQRQAARERARGLAPGDVEGWIALSDWCEARFLWPEREEALRSAVAAAPDDERVRSRRGEMRAGGEWLTLDDAEEREERENGAKGLTLYGDRWRTAGELGPLRERDRQAAGWDLVARVDQAPFVLFSDRPTRDVRKLARLIADEVRAYREFYGKAWELKDLPARFTVHAFGDRATFDRVAGKAYGSPIHPGMAGLYQRGKPVLFAMVGDAKSDPGFAHTAVHELFHALDDLCARRVGTLSSLLGVTFPTWVREGRAEHFGFSAVGGRVLVGSIGPRPGSTVHQGLADALANVPLEAFLDYDERRFYERSAFAHVCLSWALAHFLFHGEGGRHASGFRTFLARLPRRGSREDLEAAVGPLASWSRAFEAHARELIRIVEGTR